MPLPLINNAPFPLGALLVAALLAAPVLAQPATSETKSSQATTDPREGGPALANEALGLMLDNEARGQAEALLGVLFLRGMNLEADGPVALAWFERAAKAGHPVGTLAAARMLADGIGVPRDLDKARALLATANPTSFGSMMAEMSALRRTLGLPETPPPAAGPTATVAKPAPPAPSSVAVPSQPAPVAPPPSGHTPSPPPPKKPSADAELRLPPADRYTITAGRSADAASLRAITRRLQSDKPELMQGITARVLPAFEGDALRYTLLLEGLRDARSVAQLCAALTRSMADCQPVPTTTTTPSAPAAAGAAAGARAADTGGGFIQLATLFDEAQVEQERLRMERVVPLDVRGGRKIQVRSAVVNDGRSAWTLVLSGFSDIEDARAVCEKLRAQKVDCFARVSGN